MGRGGLRSGPYELDEGEYVPLVVYRANTRAERVRLFLEADPRVRAAALVGDTFNLDPVALLEEPDQLRRQVRVAAHNIVQAAIAKANAPRGGTSDHGHG